MRNCCYASPRLNCCGLVAVKAVCHWLKVIKSKFYSVTIVIVVVRCESNSSLHRNDWNNEQHGGQEWGLQQSQGSEKLYTASGREVWLVSLIQAICVCRKAFIRSQASAFAQRADWEADRGPFFLMISYISKEWFSGPPLLSCRSHIYISKRQEGFAVVGFLKQMLLRKRRPEACVSVLAGTNGKFFWQS